MQAWTFAHIVSMFAAVTLVIGGELFAVDAGRRRDVVAFRIVARLVARLDRVANVALLAGISFGLLAALAGGLNLLQGWLLIAYLLLAGALGVALLATSTFNRLVSAAEASDGDRPSPEFDRLMASGRPYLFVGTSTLFIVAIIADMVFKPSF